MAYAWKGNAKAIEEALTVAAKGKRVPIALARLALAAYHLQAGEYGFPNELQARILDAFIETFDECGYPPSQGELAEKLGITHRMAAYNLQRLEDLGLLRRSRGRRQQTRGLHPTKQARKNVGPWLEMFAEKNRAALDGCDQGDTIGSP